MKLIKLSLLNILKSNLFFLVGLYLVLASSLSAQNSNEKVIPLGYVSISSLNQFGSKLTAIAQLAKEKIQIPFLDEALTDLKDFYEKIKSLKPVMKIDVPISISLGYREKQLDLLLKKALEYAVLQNKRSKEYSKKLYGESDDDKNNKEDQSVIDKENAMLEKLQKEIIAGIDKTIALAVDLETDDSAKLLELFGPLLQNLNFGENFKLKISFEKSKVQIHNGKEKIDSKAIINFLNSQPIDVKNSAALFQFRFNGREISQLGEKLLSSEFLAKLSESGGGFMMVVGEYFSEFLRQYYNLSPAIQGGFIDIIPDNKFIAFELGLGGDIQDRIYLQLLEAKRKRSLEEIRKNGQVKLDINRPILHVTFPADLKDTIDTLEFTRGDDIYLIRNMVVFMTILTDVILLNNTKYNFWKNFNSNVDFYMHLNERNGVEATVVSDPLDAKAFGSFLAQLAKRGRSFCNFLHVNDCQIEPGKFHHKKSDSEIHLVFSTQGRKINFYTNPEIGIISSDSNLIEKIRNNKKQAAYFRYRDILPFDENKSNSQEFPFIIQVDIDRFVTVFAKDDTEKAKLFDNVENGVFFARPINNSRSWIYRLQLNFK